MPHDFKAFPELRNSQIGIYYFESPHKQIMRDFKGRVSRVVDGDTIRVTTNFRDFDTVVRLAYIAAPEKKEEGGQRSKKWLENFILGKDIDVMVDPKNRVGKWGRILGTILFGGFNINEMSKIEGQSVSFDEVDIKIWL